MKKFFSIISIMILICLTGCTNIKNQQSLSFNGKIYVLKYSKKMPKFNTYMNEYYLPEEKYNNWTELIGVYDYPGNSPINNVNALQKYLKTNHNPVDVYINKKENSAIITFMVGQGKIPTKIELNTFIYRPSENNGSIAFQYAKRYQINGTDDVIEMNKDVNAHRMEFVSLVKKVTIPKLVEKDIDLGN